MNDTEKQLINTSRLVQNAVENISAAFRGDLSGMSAIRSELDRLYNRTREYEHGTFITLVVGPAKSGKSTLVNLIAGAYVSPTNFLECTVRPSIISRRAESEENSITCYSSLDTSSRVAQIDSIIDCIRGFADDSTLADVSKERLPLTERNIKEKVELSLEESLDSETLLTSIRTPGGRLLQERVFLIDMPGFDGAYQNIDNPVYEAIAQRADLIVFVQSSNSAFSKVSKEFLGVLARRNANVPVCLVHNVFDAAWWRPEEEKKKVIESQRLVAYNEIRSLGFGIELAQCFCINLGQVRDFRSGDYPDVPQLAVAAADFDLTEEQLYKRIISNRDTIRLTNCLKRVTQQRDRLVADIQSELGSRQELLKEYERTAASLAELDKLEFRPPLSFEPDINLVAELAGYECGEARAMIADGVRKNTTDARSTVVALLTAIENAMTANVARIFPLRRLEDDLYSAYRSVMAEIAHKLSAFKGYRPPTVLDKIELSPVLDFTLSDEIDVESLVPSKHLIVGLGGHKSDAVRDYLNRVEEVLVTSPDHLDQPQNNGRLIRNVVPRATAVVEREIAHAANSYAASIASAVKTSTEAVLDSIIPGLEAFQATTARLGELASRLEALKLTVTT